MVGILQRVQRLREIVAYVDLEMLSFDSLVFSFRLACVVCPSNSLTDVLMVAILILWGKSLFRKFRPIRHV